jgi:hypothetical protein
MTDAIKRDLMSAQEAMDITKVRYKETLDYLSRHGRNADDAQKLRNAHPKAFRRNKGKGWAAP